MSQDEHPGTLSLLYLVRCWCGQNPLHKGGRRHICRIRLCFAEVCRYVQAAEEGKEFYKTIIERVMHKESELLDSLLFTNWSLPIQTSFRGVLGHGITRGGPLVYTGSPSKLLPRKPQIR